MERAHTPDDVYRLTLARMLDTFSCDRAFVAHGPLIEGVPKPRVSHGILLDSFFTSGELSLGTVRQVVEKGNPLLVFDALEDPKMNERTSAILSGVRSVMCVPVKGEQNQVAGVLYLDSRVKKQAFDPTHLKSLEDMALAAGQRLIAIGNQPAKPPLGKLQDLRVKAIQSYRERDLDEAETWLVAAREMARESGGRSLDFSRSLSDLGQLFLRSGRIEESRPLLREALEISEEHLPGVEQIASLNNLAGIAFVEGDFHQADSLLRRAKALTRKFPAQNVCVCCNLAKLALRRNRPDEAEAFLAEAKASTNELPDDHPYRAKAAEHYARFHEGTPL